VTRSPANKYQHCNHHARIEQPFDSSVPRGAPIKYFYIFAIVFLIFFSVGGFLERRARREISDKDFLLSVAASRFHPPARYVPLSPLLYQCGQKVLYEYDFDKNSLKQVEYTSAQPAPVELSVTHETVALLATGWGAGEAAAAIRVGLGVNASWKEKVTALAGALLGYTAGRWAFKRTIPPCDSEQIVQLLNKTSGRDLGQAIIKNNINRYLILADRNSILTLNSQLPLIRQAFDSYTKANNDPSRLECNPPLYRSPKLACFDFVALEKVQAKLDDPHSVWTRSDFSDSSFEPFEVSLWVKIHPDLVRTALRPRAYVGITTNQDLIAYGDNILAEQAKQLKGDAKSPFGIVVLVVAAIAAVSALVAFSLGLVSFLKTRWRLRRVLFAR